MVFSNVEKNELRIIGSNSNNSHNVGSVTLAKGIGGIKSAINGVYK
jgi:hypothetical protein